MLDQHPTRITVSGERPYDVVIGEHLLGELPAMLSAGVQRVLIVHPAVLRVTAEAIRTDLTTQGFEALLAEVPDAEASKTAAVATFLWGVLGQVGFTRSDALIGLGGGATTDLTGFVAATWLRGVPVIQVPTTLAGMVDAAVGGKTGINITEGKNLVGAFHPPAGVLCDVRTLETLPQNDFIAGLAEVIKCGFIADSTILDLIEGNPAAAVRWDSPVTRELIERSVRVKADVVGADLRESGLREILNYGHTLGHAIEQVEKYTWRHGAAVSVGLVYAAELGRLAGQLDDHTATRHRGILSSVGLPTTYRQDRWDALLAAMQRDKKTRGTLLRFVVLNAVGQPTRLEGPDLSVLNAAYCELAPPMIPR
ncbi:MAG: 3-dehydroquinate synthase [Actinomycetota bacterium]